MADEALKGKKFTPKDTSHFAAGEHFEVVEDLAYDFTGRGEVPAVRFVRLANGASTVQPRKKFLARFQEVPPAKA